MLQAIYKGMLDAIAQCEKDASPVNEAERDLAILLCADALIDYLMQQKEDKTGEEINISTDVLAQLHLLRQPLWKKAGWPD